MQPPPLRMPPASRQQPGVSRPASVQPQTALGIQQGRQMRHALPASRLQTALQSGQPRAVRAPQPQTTPTYVVRQPVMRGGGHQRIQVTLQGSPTPVGSVDMQPTRAGQAEITNLKVVQEHRRHGVARMLITAALQSAQRQGLTGARLEARPSDNSISLSSLVAMYQQLGFKGVGISRRGNPVLERRTGSV